MSENSNPKQRRGVTLRSPEDVRRLVQRLASRAFQEGSELENAGRISQLLSNWLAAWRLEQEAGKWAEIEERLALVEMSHALEKQGKSQSAKEFKQELEQLKQLVKVIEQ